VVLQLIPRYNLSMSRSAAEVLEDVRRLSPGDFDWLLGELLESGDGSSAEEIDASWKAEVERRVAEIDFGAVKMLPMEDVLARMNARILARQRG
jgi:putative addiction module component (TIGR02574 family)